MSKSFSRLSAILLTLVFAAVTACSAADRASAVPNPAVDSPIATAKSQQTAVVSGGCFWGIQAVFQHVKGVINATSGYTGGSSLTFTRA